MLSEMFTFELPESEPGSLGKRQKTAYRGVRAPHNGTPGMRGNTLLNPAASPSLIGSHSLYRKLTPPKGVHHELASQAGFHRFLAQGGCSKELSLSS